MRPDDARWRPRDAGAVEQRVAEGLVLERRPRRGPGSVGRPIADAQRGTDRSEKHQRAVIGVEMIERADRRRGRVVEDRLDGAHLAHHVGRLELDDDRLGLGWIGQRTGADPGGDDQAAFRSELAQCVHLARRPGQISAADDDRPPTHELTRPLETQRRELVGHGPRVATPPSPVAGISRLSSRGADRRSARAP